MLIMLAVVFVYCYDKWVEIMLKKMPATACWDEFMSWIQRAIAINYRLWASSSLLHNSNKGAIASRNNNPFLMKHLECYRPIHADAGSVPGRDRFWGTDPCDARIILHGVELESIWLYAV